MPQRVDRGEIARPARLLLTPGAVREIRALEVSTPDFRQPHTEAGYFDNPEALVTEVMRLWPHAVGIYTTLNPVNSALLAQAANRLKVVRSRDPLTSDRDIQERQWILLDFDPVRPTGISSMDAEHQWALDQALKVREYLRENDFPEPILADSGNGNHLRYRVQLPADDGDVIKNFLMALAGRFDTDQVKIDTTVFNPARITKLYGTLARKGDDTPDRPHRVSKLLEVPEILQPTPLDAIRAVVAALLKPAAESKPTPVSLAQDGDDLLTWCREHGLAPRQPKGMADGGLLIPLEACPFNPEHRGGSAYVRQMPNGARYFGCHYNSCQDKNWQALRDLLEPGRRSRSRRADRPKQVSADAPGEGLTQASEISGKPTSQATMLVEMVQEKSLLFHSPQGNAYAAVQVNEHQEVFALNSRTMREWCGRLYWDANGNVPGSQALQDALNVLTAIALFEGPELPIFIRLGGQGDCLYLDLADETWRVVEITRSGWQLVGRSPVMFRRPKTLGKLPTPVRGGKLDDLFSLFNLALPGQARLLLAFLLGAFQLFGPFPLLNVSGEQGSAKSTATRLLKALIDPSAPLLRSLPRNEHELLLAAQNNLVLAIDNVSRLQPWMSDALCRLSTGGGIGVRKLYSDDEEVVLGAVRPVIVNGITDFITRPDLLDRAILLELAPIPDAMRRTEKEVWTCFESLHPGLLGLLLDLVSAILANLDQTQINEPPRMADFILWVSAAEVALGWESGTLLQDYNENHNRGRAVVLEASSVAHALMRYLNSLLQQGQSTWRGSVSTLFAALQLLLSPEDDEFPTTAHHLSGELRRLSPSLRHQNVHLRFDERVGHNRDRILSIQFAGFDADADSQANSNHPVEDEDDAPTRLENTSNSASASDRGPRTPERDTFDL
jgi:hypothetical protein